MKFTGVNPKNYLSNNKRLGTKRGSIEHFINEFLDAQVPMAQVSFEGYEYKDARTAQNAICQVVHDKRIANVRTTKIDGELFIINTKLIDDALKEDKSERRSCGNCSMFMQNDNRFYCGRTGYTKNVDGFCRYYSAVEL